MIVCFSCNQTDFVEAYTAISHSWFKCLNCEKVVSVRVQNGRGSRVNKGIVEEELTECSGVINVTESIDDYYKSLLRASGDSDELFCPR